MKTTNQVTRLIFCFIILTLVFAVCFAKIGFFPRGSLLSGLGYAPDLATLLLLGTAWVLAPDFSEWSSAIKSGKSSIIAKLKKGHQVAMSGLFLFVLLTADHSLFSWFLKNSTEFEHPEKRNTSDLTGSQDTFKSLTVVSLNLRYFSFGVIQIADLLRLQNADVFFFSETTATQWDMQYLTRALPQYQFVYSRVSETAIATKLPILRSLEVELPSNQASVEFPNEVKEQKRNPYRSFVHAIVNFYGTPINMIPIRFVAGRGPETGIRQNIKWGQYLLDSHKKELNFFENYLSKVEGPVVFGGDLNATPGSFVVNSISRQFQDLWFAQHFLGHPTFSTFKFLFARLDFLFCRGAESIGNVETLEPMVSDHEVLAAEISFAIGNPSGIKIPTYK